ncbi:Kdo hydroxylase family protein [Pseudacidovorax intermedius]|uniref:Kdo hydroxylase family protein n=1 Tax=Pseudacidovorax intermedius TaxID=433924 RepID=UPI0026EF002F|nr:Kdo hydroxylase family protein [Pseudacidovorax intermedius]
MDSQIIEITASSVGQLQENPAWTAALESGKVLYFPHFGFGLSAEEQALLRPEMRDPKSRNISLDADGRLKGLAGEGAVQAAVTDWMGRFRVQSQELIARLLPGYQHKLRLAPTSLRPSEVESREQSWRADDRRLHVDAFPSRPNRGERILRVFTNIHPSGGERVWRVGEPFETVARTFLPRAKPYALWQAKALAALHVTKSLRSEYDHLMLQLHDGMKRDLDYQRNSPQQTVRFPAGSTWVCFSDQTSHAAMSGQYMMEQTLFLRAGGEYDHAASPLGILTRLTGRSLVGADAAG